MLITVNIINQKIPIHWEIQFSLKMTIGFIFITYTAEQETAIILKEKQRQSCRVLY